MTRWKPDPEGRLMEAAVGLFATQGYDETTVAEIAGAAGLTRRTFFRYFADKREVLFRGSGELTERWIAGMEAADPGSGPLACVAAGLDDIAEMFATRLDFARRRSLIIDSHPELQERELIKLQSLAHALADVLEARGVSHNAAILAAQSGVTVFHVAFARWVAQEDPAALRRLVEESFDELRAVTAGGTDLSSASARTATAGRRWS